MKGYPAIANYFVNERFIQSAAYVLYFNLLNVQVFRGSPFLKQAIKCLWVAVVDRS